MGLLKAVLGVSLFAIFVHWQFFGWSDIERKQQFWQSGTVADSGEWLVEEDCRTYVGVSFYCKYTVEGFYIDAHEVSHAVDFSKGVVGTLGQSDVSIKYNPLSPSDYMVSLDRPSLRSWLLLVCKIILIAMCIFLVLGGLWNISFLIRRAHAVALHSDEILFEIVSYKKGPVVSGTRLDTVSYLMPSPSMLGAMVTKKKGMPQPLVVSREGKQYLVALVSDRFRRSPVIVQSNLMPFVFSEQQQAEIQSHISEAVERAPQLPKEA